MALKLARLGAEVDEDGLDAASCRRRCEGRVFGGCGGCGSDGVGADPESFADAAVGEAFGHEREHFAFAVGEFVERVGVASAVEQRIDQLAVDDQLSGGDAVDGSDELGGVEHSVFLEIAAAAFVAVE